MSLIISRAQEFAHNAHDSISQKRKYTGQPYWRHTDEVAALVASVTDDEFMIAAAHLHDTLEDVFPVDPFYSIDLIRSEFGKRVAQYVTELTDVYTKEKYPAFNRRERKELERKRLGKISNNGKTIKLADLVSNSADIVANDPGFAKTYLKEKWALLPYLILGDTTLYGRAYDQCADGMDSLGIGPID